MILLSIFASILIVEVALYGPGLNTTSKTPPPPPQPKQNSSSGNPQTSTDHIDARRVRLEDIRFPIKRSALLYDGQVGNVNVLLKRMRQQFHMNSILLTSHTNEEMLKMDVGHVPGVLEFDTSFFPGKVCGSFSTRSHHMILRLNGKVVEEEDQNPMYDGGEFLTLSHGRYNTEEEIEQDIPSIANNMFVEWKTTGVYLAPMKMVKIHVERTCRPITDVSTGNPVNDDATLLNQLSTHSTVSQETKDTPQWKRNILHLYKVQRQLDLGSIGFRVGALTHKTGESPNNISRVPIPFEEFPLYGLSKCEEGVFCLTSQLGGPLLVTKYPRFDIPELPSTDCSFNIKLKNVADTTGALHTMPSYKAGLTNEKLFLESLKMRGGGGGDAPAPTLSLSKLGEKITLLPRTEDVRNDLSNKKNMASIILSYHVTMHRAELVFYNSLHPYYHDSKLNYDIDVSRGTKNFRYWFVSDVQVPSNTASDDRFVYTKYKNQLVVSVPNTGGFHLTNTRHPDYSDLVVFSVMKSFHPTVADDVLGKIPDWVMSFELWHFLAHLSGVFETNLGNDEFLSKFHYDDSYYREMVRYPAQGTDRSWWSEDTAWETKAAFFIDVFLMISKPVWLQHDAPEDHHHASLAPSQTIQNEMDQQPSYDVRRKRKIGPLTPAIDDITTTLNEDPVFSQQVRTRNIGYISDLMPDLVARCTSLLYKKCVVFLRSVNMDQTDDYNGVINIIPDTLDECVVPLLEPKAKQELDNVLKSWKLWPI